ncbi:MAG: RDD family protein, partial [Micrococcales bacterium]|nr:RDD family protein [Micrococcales bacterium]
MNTELVAPRPGRVVRSRARRRHGEPSALIWRVYAAGFDTLAVVGPAVVVALVVGGGGGVFLAVVVAVVLLMGQMHLQGQHGWTIAQRQMSLKVVDHRTGRPIGTGRAAQRLVIAPIALTSAPFDQSGRHRGWHDLLMGTEVIDLGVPRPKTKKGAAQQGFGISDLLAPPTVEMPALEQPADAQQATRSTGALPAWAPRQPVSGAVPAGDLGTGPTPVVELEPVPAALMWRLYAAMFDVLLVGVPVLVASLAVSGPSGTLLATELGVCVLVVELFLQGRFGGTIAQGLMRIRVVDQWTGEPVGMGRAVRRLSIIVAGGMV